MHSAHAFRADSSAYSSHAHMYSKPCNRSGAADSGEYGAATPLPEIRLGGCGLHIAPWFSAHAGTRDSLYDRVDVCFRNAGRNQHLPSKDVEREPIDRADQRTHLSTEHSDLVGAVHPVNAEFLRFRGS